MNKNDIITLVVFLALWGYISLCIWRIAGKTKTEHKWMAWIPLLNLFLVCRIGGESGWGVLLCFIPYIGPVVATLLLLQLPKALGITNATRFLAVIPFVNFIYLGYLAFRKEQEF